MGRAIPYVVFPPFIFPPSLARFSPWCPCTAHAPPVVGDVSHTCVSRLTPFQAGVSLPIRVPTHHWGGLFALPTVSVSCPTASFFASTILLHLVHPSQVFFHPLLFPTRGLEP